MTNETANWKDCVNVVRATLCVDASGFSTTSDSEFRRVADDDLTQDERHALMDGGGSLDFWNDPGEDIYSLEDGDPT